MRNSLFDKRDDLYWPDRTMNEDKTETLFEFKEVRTEEVYENFDNSDLI